MSSNPHSPSPLSPRGGVKPPYRMPPRSVTSPLPRRPPSPDYNLPQDCAFPPFPPVKSRSPTPKMPSEPRSSFETRSTKLGELVDGHIALKPRTDLGEQVVQRMQNMAPGPFNVHEGNEQNQSHRRIATTSGSKETTISPSTYSAKNFLPRPSTADSNYKRINSLSSISRGPHSGLIRSKTVGTELPSSSIPSKPARQNQVDQAHDMPMPKQNPSIVSLRQDAHSQIFSFDRDNGSKVDGSIDVHSTKTVETLDSSHTRKPSVASVNRPLEEIGSTTSYRSFRSNPPRAGSPAKQQIGSNQPSPPRALSRSRRQNGQILNIVPPVSIPRRNDEYHADSLYHTPTESTSSRESSGSDANSRSSRSSPPLSESAYRPRRKSSADTSRIEGLMNDIQATISDVLVKDEPLKPPRLVPPSFSRPTYARPVNPTPIEAVAQSPESPMDPSLRDGRYSPILSPIERTLSPQPLQNTTRKASTSLPQTASQHSSSATPLTLERPLVPPVQPPPPSSPVRRTTAINKGKCRGCNEIITGKSVSSADGRLTGRYHKNCFVCKTCKEPFQTADFYVIGNHPYCSRHYHQLNGSLCRTCDRGIEGQYLETELKQKFHPSCFTCQVAFPTRCHIWRI